MIERLWFLNTEVTIVVAAAQESRGISVMRFKVPQGDSPPLHVHRDEDETFHIISGTLTCVVGGSPLHLTPGQTARVAKGIAHTYLAESPGGAEFLTITGGGSFEAFVRALGRTPSRLGLPHPSPPPTPEEAEGLRVLAAAHAIDLVGPPLS